MVCEFMGHLRHICIFVGIFFSDFNQKKGQKRRLRHKILRGESVHLTLLPSRRCEIIETDRRIESSGRIVFLFSLVNCITAARCYF